MPEHSDWDRPRARLRPEEIVLPRSGLGSVAKNRVAIYLDQRPALVGSFVDRIRLAGLDPLYTLLCLKTELVWSQIHRLINGIGTPNISFDEVRSLLIPILPDATQQQLRAAYLADVHSHHLRWLAGDRSARDTALRNFRALAREIDRLAGTAHEST